jgi:hypothetical protein
MTCSQLENGVCLVAKGLCGIDVFPNSSQCEYCTKSALPSQAINKVTVSLSIPAARDNATRLKILQDHGHLLTHIEVCGPGTELKKLIAWFYSPEKKNCKCPTRIAKMNKWGADKCEENIDTIMRWLKHSATINSILFVEPAVRLLVWLAIRRARKKCSKKYS